MLALCDTCRADIGIPDATYITCSVVPDGAGNVNQIKPYPTKKKQMRKQQKVAHSDDGMIFFSDDAN